MDSVNPSLGPFITDSVTGELTKRLAKPLASTERIPSKKSGIIITLPDNILIIASSISVSYTHLTLPTN